MVERLTPNSKELTEFLGVRIRETRELLGMTQNRLAEHVGVTPEQINSFEAGIERPEPVLLVKMAASLDTPLQSFFDGWEEWKKTRKLLTIISNDV